MPRWSVRMLRCLVALVLGGALVHVVVDALGQTDPSALRPRAISRQLALWGDAAARDAVSDALRRGNPEWDLMHRMFAVLALADAAIADQGGVVAMDATARIDEIVADTRARIAADGQRTFLLPYVDRDRFRDPAGRSLFVDGELALMLAVQHHLEPTDERARVLAAHTDALAAALERGPIGSAESYPDECWTFCNTVALAAIRIADVDLGRDHAALLAAWVAAAREHLVDRDTGLLIASYHHDGTRRDGPEGSSAWMAAHNLLLVDPAFARAQYDAARSALAIEFAGFAWSREWPARAPGALDIDSGPVVPVLDASPGASGLALLGAAAFADEDLLRGLTRSLELAAVPIDRGDGGRRWLLATPLGDAIAARALSFGPLWASIGAPGEVR